jgi:hypothetical protein
MTVTVFAQNAHRENAMLGKQSTYVFAVVKKHLNA